MQLDKPRQTEGRRRRRRFVLARGDADRWQVPLVKRFGAGGGGRWRGDAGNSLGGGGRDLGRGVGAGGGDAWAARRDAISCPRDGCYDLSLECVTCGLPRPMYGRVGLQLAYLAIYSILEEESPRAPQLPSGEERGKASN